MTLMANKEKKKRDTTLDDILESTENVNQIGVEQARSLSRAETYEKSVESIWGVPAPVATKRDATQTPLKDSRDIGGEDHPSLTKNKGEDIVRSKEDSSIELPSIEESSIEVSSSKEQSSIESPSIEENSIEESGMEEHTSIELSSIEEQSSIEQKAIDDPSQLTTDSHIILYTIRNFPTFIRQRTDLNPNEKLVLEHIFDRALLEGSHIITMTNSDIETNLSISYKWAGKTLQSLVQKNWIDHKLSLSKTNKSKVSIEKALANFVEEKSLNIDLPTLLNQMFNVESIEESSIDPYMFVLLVSKNIYLRTNKQNIAQSMEQNSIDNVDTKNLLLYFSSYQSLKQILTYAWLKGFDIQQISRKLLFGISDMFSDNTYGDKIPLRSQKVEEIVAQGIFYAAPKAKKNKWGYLEKTLKDGWAMDMTIDEHDRSIEELEMANHMCESPEKVSLFGLDEIRDLLSAFPALTKTKDVNAKNIEKIRKDIKDFFIFSPKAVEDFLEKNGFKSRKPSDDLRA